MKKFFFAACILMLPGMATHAQVNILTRGGDHLYIGIDNAVTITSTKLDVKKLTVSVDRGTITGADGFYTVRCTAPLAHTTIKVWDNGKLVAQKNMDIQRVSDPVVYALGKGSYKSGTISKSALPQLYALAVKTNVSFLNISPIHFTFKRMRNNEMLDQATNDGPEISENIKALIKNASVGDTILFDEIKCLGSDTDINLLTLKLTVTAN